MPSEWRKVPADQFCLSVRDGTHDSPKPAASGRFLVTSRHITSGRLDLTGAYRISQADFDAVNERSKVDRWDVLVSMIGTVGQPHLVKEEPDFAIKNIGLFKSKGEVEGKWLYYYLKTPYAQQLVKEQARGTTQAYIPLNALRDFPIPLPDDVRVMRTVTDILGALDDKIELNRKVNETLEQMARAIFKSWFVDFEPVRDRGLVDSELGRIPKGWSVQPISEFADVVGGSTPSTGEPQFWTDGRHCWATPKDFAPLDVPVLLDTERRITDAGVQQISSGLLPVGTVLLSSRAPIGYLAIAETPVAINQGFIAMLPKGAVSNLFLLHWSRHNHEVIVGRANGTTFLEISKSNFRPILVVAPPTDAMKAFDAHVRPMYNRVVANTRQSRTLAAIRDALLPKLMSGDVKAEAFD